MNKGDLIRLIVAHRENSLGIDDGELTNERAESMDRYHGRPYGDEVDGRSKVVTKDLSETVNWIMPTTMETLFASGSPVEFIPMGKEDEEAAQQQTDYINHVIMNDNRGFIAIHDAIKDIFLLKNGYIKHYFDESIKISEEEYKSLTPDALLKLVTDLEREKADVEILEKEIDEQSGLARIRLKIKKTTNRERIEAVPVEEIRVSKDCRGTLQESNFVEHLTQKTRTDLIQMGMDKEFVNGLSATSDTTDSTLEHSRNTTSDETTIDLGVMNDRSMDLIDYTEAYFLVDWDEDGIAELRKVITVNDKIPDGKEWNEVITSIPITGGVAQRVPHRHVGESINDDLSDLARIRTFLFRQALDNTYNTNNSETIINERAFLPDFVASVPGGYRRVSGEEPVQGAVMANPVTPVLDQILPMIQMVDKVKGARTGINETTTAVDPDVLKATTKGAFSEGLRQASQKVRMMIRMIAETLMRELALRVHEDLIKYQDIPRMINLRGKYVEINPAQWRERTDMIVKVGLGTGTEDEKRANLMLVTQLQQQMAQQGLVSPQNSYKLFKDIAETMSIVNPDKYVLDPTSDEFKQLQQERAQKKQPNPLAEAEAVKGEMLAKIKQLEGQQKLELDRVQQAAKAQMDLFKAKVDMSNKERDRQSKEAIESAKLEVKALIEGLNIDIGKAGLGAGLDGQ